MATQFRACAPATIEQRGALRLPVAVSGASVRRHSEQPADATLLDLSVYGCRVATDGEFVADERIFVRLTGGLPIPAAVIWVEDGVLGCRFNTPIARSLLRSVVLSLA